MPSCLEEALEEIRVERIPGRVYVCHPIDLHAGTLPPRPRPREGPTCGRIGLSDTSRVPGTTPLTHGRDEPRERL